MNILITGASSGIGLGAAKAFADQGHKVGVVARRAERLDALNAYNGDITPFPGDVTQPDQMREIVETFEHQIGPCHALVNSAGLAKGVSPAPKANLDDWKQMIDVNCFGLVCATHKVLPAMVERGEGLIVNVGSVAGRYAYPGSNVYGASKAFVQQFSQNLRVDLRGTRIRVCTIEPGTVAGSEFSNVRYDGDMEAVTETYAGWNSLHVEHIVDQILWVALQPHPVNITTIESMSVQQTLAGFHIDR